MSAKTETATAESETTAYGTTTAAKEALAILDAAVAATPHGQAREGQREMCAAVADAVSSGKHLLVQAGTGTGKSLAYLCAALAAGETVVVSTATLALQHQLVAVDLPRLVEAVAPILGRKPSFALVKGRHNYVCKRKIAGEEDEDDGAIEGHRDPEMGRAAGELHQAGAAPVQLGERHRHRGSRRSRPGRERPGLEAGLDFGDRVHRREPLPAGTGLLRRVGPGARPRGRHHRHQPCPAVDRHDARPDGIARAHGAHRRRGA